MTRQTGRFWRCEPEGGGGGGGAARRTGAPPSNACRCVFPSPHSNTTCPIRHQTSDIRHCTQLWGTQRERERERQIARREGYRENQTCGYSRAV